MQPAKAARNAALTLSAAATLASAQPIVTPINFNYQWTDQAGVNHGFDAITLTAFDENNVQLGQTNLNNGMGTINIMGGEPDGIIELYLQVTGTINGVVQNIRTVTGLGTPGQTTSLTVNNFGFPGAPVPQGMAQNVTPTPIAGTNAFDRALITAQLIRRAHDYYLNTLGFNAPVIDLHYQFAGNQAFYNAAGAGNNARITIAGDDYRDYDVVTHEYAHHIANRNSMDESPGGSHRFFKDNIRARGSAAQGTRLAYNEGLASYLGITSYLGMNPSPPNNLPATATDVWTNDDRWGANGQLTQSNTAYNLETFQQRIGTNAATTTNVQRKGEGDEAAVMRALWDFYDTNADAIMMPRDNDGTDRIAYGDANLWNRVLSANNGSATMQQFWDAVTDDLRTGLGRDAAGLPGDFNGNHAIERAGAILQNQGISADARTSGKVNIFNPNHRFVVREQNNDNSQWFRVAFFDLDWTFVGWTDPKQDPNHNAPGAGAVANSRIEFNLIGEDLIFAGIDFKDDFYYWVALSNPAGDTSMVTGLASDDFVITGDDWYWSAAELVQIVPTSGSTTILAAGLVLTTRRRRS